MTKPLWVTGQTLIIESGFCVLGGLIGMFGRCKYGIALAKNSIYWPTEIYGDVINYHSEIIGDHE